jgi:DNA-binding GntR family transcriptional regulator
MTTAGINELIAQQSNRYRTATQYVVDVLRESIINGTFEAGQALAQEDLGSRFNVSRAPIREALRILEAQGLVETLPHKGARVASIREDEVLEIFEIRAALEALAIRKSIPRLTTTDLKETRKILVKLDKERDINGYIELHRAFHMSLYRGAGARLLALIGQHFDVAERYLRLEASSLDNSEESQLHHHQLLRACEEGDIATAVANVSNIGQTGEQLVQTLNMGADGKKAAV